MAESKTADRPHNLSVLLSIIALLASGASAWFSYQAVSINREIGAAAQQAYVTVRATKMKTEMVTRRRARVPNLVFTFEIYNGGNTPAENVFSEQVATFGLEDQQSSNNIITRIESIGPKDSGVVTNSIAIPQSWSSGSHLTGSVILRGRISYMTRLQPATQFVSWCKTYSEDEGFTECSLKELIPVE